MLTIGCRAMCTAGDAFGTHFGILGRQFHEVFAFRQHFLTFLGDIFKMSLHSGRILTFLGFVFMRSSHFGHIWTFLDVIFTRSRRCACRQLRFWPQGWDCCVTCAGRVTPKPLFSTFYVDVPFCGRLQARSTAPLETSLVNLGGIKT